MRRTMLYLMLLLPFAGCQIPQIQFGLQDAPWSPRAKLVAARQGFNAAVDVLTALRKQGTFTETQGGTLELFVDEGRRILDRWQAAINVKQPTAGYAADLARVRVDMEAVKVAAEGSA